MERSGMTQHEHQLGCAYGECFGTTPASAMVTVYDPRDGRTVEANPACEAHAVSIVAGLTKALKRSNTRAVRLDATRKDAQS